MPAKPKSMNVNRCVVRTAYRKRTTRMVANAVIARILAVITLAPKTRNVLLMSSQIQHLDQHLLPFVARVSAILPSRFRFDSMLFKCFLILFFSQLINQANARNWQITRDVIESATPMPIVATIISAAMLVAAKYAFHHT